MAGQADFGIGKKEYKCEICRDIGKVNKNGKIVDCECKRNKLPELVDEITFESQIDKYVPEQYKGTTYDMNLVLNSNLLPPEYKKNPEVINFLNTMQKLYSKIMLGQKFNYSLFISAPQNMGKNNLVYACLETSLKIGKTVAPYLDSLKIYGMIYNYWEQNDGIVNQLETADICFIKHSTGYTDSKVSMQAIKVIVDRRARNGLPTFVVTRTGLNYLEKVDPYITDFIIRGNYGESKVDYDRLRVVEAPPLFKKTEKNTNTKKNWS